MGNKIGFEADSQTVKLAYVQQDEDHIKFIMSLKSKYLKNQIKWGNGIIFLFQCTVSEFINYHTSDNVTLLRNQYQKLLSASELVIRTNRATMNTIKENKSLQNALTDILMKKFQLEHTERIENSVHAMHILEKNHHQFFNFKHTFSILQLHSFHEKFSDEKHILKHMPERFVLVFLRNGITAYRIELGKKIERIEGSVIGEKTMTSIFKFKFPQLSVQQCFELAFNGGDIKKVDLMVQDIYGKNSQTIGLPGQIVASSMGKYAKMGENQLKNITSGDIIRSLITTFAINTANLIGLYLATTKLNDAIVLADTFHTDKFYALIQAIGANYAPHKNIYFANHAPFMGCLGSAFTNYLS